MGIYPSLTCFLGAVLLSIHVNLLNKYNSHTVNQWYVVIAPQRSKRVHVQNVGYHLPMLHIHCYQYHHDVKDQRVAISL
jgi:hypothetical protein